MICSLQNIRYRFEGKGAKNIFSLSHLTLKKGEHCLILGPSGCGKSTLLHLLAASLTPNEGEIQLLGQDMMALSSLEKDRFRAENMGVIFQQFNLLPFADIYTNIALALRFSVERKKRVGNIKEEVKRLLAALNFEGDEWLYKKAAQLSVGQQQRVAAARALIGGPPLILADEPTSALDEQATSRFIELVFNGAQQQDSTLIMVSHDIRLKSHFNRIINLDEIAEIKSC